MQNNVMSKGLLLCFMQYATVTVSNTHEKEPFSHCASQQEAQLLL